MTYMDNILNILSSYSLKVLFAIIIFLIGTIIVKKITESSYNLIIKRSNIDEILVKFLKDVIFYILMIVVLLTSLKQIGVDTTSFFAILGAAGLAIGLALKDSLGNFASGVMIILFRPFKIGDFINAGGVSGTVEELTIFNTILKTGDNQKIIVPNSIITNGTITNVNAKPERRVDLLIGISYDDDIKKAKNLLRSIVESDERVLKDKDIIVAVSELADSSVNFIVRGWVKTPDYWSVKYDLTENIKISFDNEGISIPFPQQVVHHYNN